MLLTEEVEIIWGNNRKKYEPKGYIYTKKNDKFKVGVEDLPLGSSAYVNVLCDYCFEEGIETIKNIRYSEYIRSHKSLDKDACFNCRFKKEVEVNLIKHGVKSIFSLKSSQEKYKETMFKRYGVNYTAESPELFDKMKKTNLEKYNCKYSIEIPEAKEKSKNTMMMRYGAIYYPLTDEFRKNNSKENHYNWQGGITSENQSIRSSFDYKQWRISIFERDNYICQCCGDDTGGNLQAHHKYNFAEYPELRFDTNNGITLCDKCHDFRNICSFHNIYGTRNNTPDQLEQYIKDYKIKNNNEAIQQEKVI
jgi:5-methylcytosine-specific restriction endonuclease McrA